MPKVVLDKREAEIWLKIKSDPTSRYFKILDALNLLAGDMGGHGIDLVDEEGNSLESTCSYVSPPKKNENMCGMESPIAGHPKCNLPWNHVPYGHTYTENGKLVVSWTTPCSTCNGTGHAPTTETKPVSLKWVLRLLAGMSFPDSGQAYDFIKKAVEINPTKPKEV